jgi:hypothetical protein
MATPARWFFDWAPFGHGQGKQDKSDVNRAVIGKDPQSPGDFGGLA